MKVRCVKNTKVEVSLLIGKIYQAEELDAHMYAVIDEENEEYVYPKSYFEIVEE